MADTTPSNRKLSTITPGVAAINAERDRQVLVEGYDASHDAGHTTDLVKAAASYLLHAITPKDPGWMWAHNASIGLWPWDRDYYKPKTIREDLVRAGAMIAAALDALPKED